MYPWQAADMLWQTITNREVVSIWDFVLMMPCYSCSWVLCTHGAFQILLFASFDITAR